jgi:hypothetical protein
METVRDEVVDISLTCGFRDKARQNYLYGIKRSKVQWPNGKHNVLPSKAVDFQPYPYPRNDPKLWGALGYIAGRAIEIAKRKDLSIRWGGDWDQDGDLTDQSFDDLFHLELY